MSDVTGVVLCTSLQEYEDNDDDVLGPCWQKVQSWLTERGFEPLEVVDSKFSGTKHPQMIVGGAGYNYFLAREEFAAFVIGLPWERPENVALVLQPEDGPFDVYRAKRR